MFYFNPTYIWSFYRQDTWFTVYYKTLLAITNQSFKTVKEILFYEKSQVLQTITY